MKPTDEQVKCVEEFSKGEHFKINAFAGSGKTSTLIQIAEAATNLRGTFLAFNKSIAEEAKRRFPSNVSCSTVHGLAFRAMREFYSIEKMTNSVNGAFLASKMGLKGYMLAGDVWSPRRVGFLVNESVKRYMRSGRREVTEWDVAVVGKLEHLDDKYIKQYKQFLLPHVKDAWEKMQDPSSDIPLSHDGYLKRFQLSNPTIPGDFVMLDEAQDTNGVVLEMVKRQKSQMVAVGDACQPPGSMVEKVTERGVAGKPAVSVAVPIESLLVGDRVVSYNISQSVLHKDGCEIRGITVRPFSGELVVLKTACGLISRYTPDHHCVVRYGESLVSKFVVYMMKRGKNFRIGITSGRMASQAKRLGVTIRAWQEDADAMWILSVHNTRQEAALAEVTTAWMSGVPTLTFVASNNHTLGQKHIDLFWESIGDNSDKAAAVLKGFGRDIAYPLWQKGQKNLQTRKTTTVRACNLIEGMQVLTHTEALRLRKKVSIRNWSDFTLSREAYEGPVYSMDVDRDNTYVSDGIVTHNCQAIYGWRGATNAMTELPYPAQARLTISFRFGDGLANYASQILRVLGEQVPIKGNPAKETTIGFVGNPRAVLARTNGGVIAELIDALEDGLTPCIVGGTAELLSWVSAAEKLMAGRPVESPLELYGFSNWQEVVDASKEDEGKDLRRWVSLIEKHGTAEIRRILERLPKDEDEADLVLSTGHKAKGREWETVRLCDDFLMGASEDEVKDCADEELRLFYVAATRAMSRIRIPETLHQKLEKVAESRGVKCIPLPYTDPTKPATKQGFAESLFA